MGRGDNRRSMKMRRKISGRKKKERDLRKKNAKKVKSPEAAKEARPKAPPSGAQS